jgi:hypothetical protein
LGPGRTVGLAPRAQFIASNFSSEDRDILAHPILAHSGISKECGKNMVGKNIQPIERFRGVLPSNTVP